MTKTSIRKMNLEDLELLQKIGRQTFSETFSSENTDENMQTYLEKAFSDEKLSTELIDPHSELYLAEKNSQVVGYLKLNFGPSQTELKDIRSLEIERIYVLKEYHGKMIGQILLDRALEVANSNNLDYIWLGVWEENKKAIDFYKKNGFVLFDKHIFKLGNEEQTDWMMKLELKKHF